MKKSILNIEGVQILSKAQKTNIKAGSSDCCSIGTTSSLFGSILDWVCGCEES